jgi:hypothetical protein
VNLSGKAGFEEGKWGYDALLANQNQDAVRWLRDATKAAAEGSRVLVRPWHSVRASGNMPAAMAAYQRAHALDPHDPKYAEATKKN